MIIGVVLCGGSSTRMGNDKGMMQHGSQTWAQIAFNKLRSLNIPVAVSINPVQHTAYHVVFSEELLVTDNDELNVGGPLKGILSAHQQYPQADLMVLAVDIVKMSEELLWQLYLYPGQPDTEAIVYKQEAHAEPLCGIYKAKALHKIVQLYEAGKLKKYSMHFILDQLQTVYIDVPSNQEDKFNNFNSESDLANLQH